MYFLCFLGSVVALGITVMAGFMTYLAQIAADNVSSASGGQGGSAGSSGDGSGPGEELSMTVTNLIIFLVGLPTAVLTVVLLGFLAFHLYISCTETTTKAVVRAHRSRKGPTAVGLQHDDGAQHDEEKQLVRQSPGRAETLRCVDGQQLSGVVAFEAIGATTTVYCVPSFVPPREWIDAESINTV